MATRGWNDVTAADVAKMGRKATTMPQVKTSGRSKYGAVKTVVDGVTFDSKAEARRYVELKALRDAGEITHLLLQPRYGIYARPLTLDPVLVAHYVGDFQYYTKDGELIVEDVKGVKTPMYRLKKKFIEAHYGIQIREVR